MSNISDLATSLAQASPMTSNWLHLAVFMGNGQVLGDEAWRVESVEGSESISEPYDFKLVLRANTDASGQRISFDDIVGRPITLALTSPTLDAAGQQPSRDAANAWFQEALDGQDRSDRLVFFNGIVADFSLEQPGVYRIGMRPALWTLTLTNAYRVLTQMSVRDAIAHILRLHKVAFSVDALVGSDNLATTRVQDWLQAGESDYELIKRLMSKAHVYYYIKSSARQHVVVFANRPAYAPALPKDRALRYCFTTQDEEGPLQPDTITQYSLSQSLISSTVNGTFTLEESACDHDALASYQSYRSPPTEQQSLPFEQYMIYKYGGSGHEVTHFTSATQDCMETASRSLSGASHCPFLRAGHRFETTPLPREGQQPPSVSPALDGVAWVATKVEHHATGHGTYHNSFTAVSARGLVTPVSLQDTQQGSVLARVVAVNAGDQASPDSRFYPKNAFDLQTQQLQDTQGVPDGPAKGLCVVLASDPSATPVWVKLSANMETVPEIDAMVMISRSQDQSELPEVQGIVASHGNLTVTPSGWIPGNSVGSTYNTTYGDGISIRFGRQSQANLEQAKQIVCDAYQSGRFRDASYSQGASYSYATSESGVAGLLSQSVSHGSTENLAQGDYNNSTSTFNTTRNESLVKESSINVSTVLGLSKNTTTQTLVENSSNTGASNSVDAVGLSNSLSATGVAISANATGVRKQLSMEGVSSNTSLTGESSNSSVTGVSTQVSAVGASSGVDVVGASVHTSLTGSETSVRLVGVSENTSLTGAAVSTNLSGSQTDVGLTGVSSRVSVTGSSTNVSVVGESTDVSVMGEVNNVTIKGATTSVDISGAGVSVQLAAAVMSVNITGLVIDIPDMKIYV